MDNNPSPIEFYFDFSSPYAYLMARDLTHLGQRHGRAIQWHPFLLGSVFKANHTQPPFQRPDRQAYLLKEVHRTARRKGLRLNMPDSFPFSSLMATRAFWWVHQTSVKRATHFAAALLDSVWIDGADLTDEAVIADVARRFDLDDRAMLEAIQTQPIKDLTRQKCDQAEATGLFGSPWVVVDGESFWGNDRLDDIAHWLDTGGW